MAPSLESFLNPHVFADGNRAKIQEALQARGLVLIRDALNPGLAESVYSALDTSEEWRLYEGASEDFHFHHHNLNDPSLYPPGLLQALAIFTGDGTKSVVSVLSGKDCSGPATFSASWYMPGDYSLPHNDCSREPFRQVAFIWHLTKQWDPRWGGHLFWGPTQELLRPSFNTLVLFLVTPSMVHFVAPVSAAAVGKRLTVNGWWSGPEDYPESVRDDSAVTLTIKPPQGEGSPQPK